MKAIRSRNWLKVLAEKRIDESLQKPKENLSATQLHEHVSDGGVGKQVKKDKTMPNLLIESLPVQLTLTEGKNGKLVARGEFGRVNVPTQNGRIYPEELMGREIKRLGEDLSNRRILGCLDHPENGKTSLKDVSHIVTDLQIKDGIVIGEAEILNTPEGQTLKALIEAQAQIGVSSRGFGSTRPSSNSKMEGEIVQDDFVLKTWDFVADPAVKTAIPAVYTEDVDGEQPDTAQMFLDEFPEVATKLQEDAIAKAKLKVDKGVDEAVAEAEARVKSELAENFERQLAKVLIEAKEDLSKELREEFETDPNLGGAKAALAAVWEVVAPFKMTEDEKVVTDAQKARELEFAEAKDKAIEAEKRAIKAECMGYIEREIGGHPMAESIRKLVKKQKFESLEDAKEKLEAILKDLPDRTEEGLVSKEDVSLMQENAVLKDRLTTLTERVEKLNVKLKKAVDVGLKADTQRQNVESRVQELEEELEKAENAKDVLQEELEIESYKHQQVARLPNKAEMLELLEGVTSKTVVDKLIKREGVKGVSQQQLNESRRKLQRGMGLDEEPKKGVQPLPIEGGGLDEKRMLELAGIASIE